MSHKFISLFINMLNAKMIWEAMGLLHAQPLSPFFLPIPLQMQGSSLLSTPPQRFFFNHCSSRYLSFYGGGSPGILHNVQGSEMALKEKSHSRETEFGPGVEVQRVSTQGTLQACWLQPLCLCKVPGVLTLKSTPIISLRTPPKPGLSLLTTLLPCFLLQRTGCPFSGLRHKHPFPAQLVSQQTAAHSCLTCYVVYRDALKGPRYFL